MVNSGNATKNEISHAIKMNDIIVEKMNQDLHNFGIEFNQRLDIIINILNNDGTENNLIKNNLIESMEKMSINKSEIYQKIFMFYGNKKTKIDLNQFYTPVTIGEFICSLCIPGKTHIDPACGTGDLIINYSGKISLWDISEDIIEICKLNYNLQQKDYIIECCNSIIQHDKNNGEYDYCSLNPPFGSSTVITDSEVLNKYDLGRGKKKEEIGILFIERAINLLKENGIIFIILPNGYLGNNTKNSIELRKYLLSYRILCIIELPHNAFSRSGTGVSTSMLILQKTRMDKSYNIFIHKIENIGYILNKKNTPYKYKMNKGDYVLVDNKPILDNDFESCKYLISNFINKYLKGNLKGDLKGDLESDLDFNTISTNDLDTNNILDINRYSEIYKNVVNNMILNNKKKLKDYLKSDVNCKFNIISNKEYLYLDIKQVNSPTYNKTNLIFGYELPNRAKIELRKNDIIVSKLKGKIVFTIILDELDNIICTNGFCLLRPNSLSDSIIIFANLFSKEFKIQHNSFCTGSIMESISDFDIKNIYINDSIDIPKYTLIMEALEVINSEL